MVPITPPNSRKTTASDLASLEALATTTRTRLLALRANLLTLRAQHAPSTSTPTTPTTPIPTSPQPPTTTDDTRLLTFALSRSQQLAAHTRTTLHRIAGITTFAAQDAHTRQKLLGVRFDVFSQRTRGFAKAVYVLLEKRVVEKGMGEVWVVSRHSAPAFVGVAEVARRCLPMGELEGFVREVRRRLVAWRRRVDAVEGVWGGGREVECDDEVAEVVVRWGDREARCRVGERAVVERAVVMVGKGGRAPEVERKLVGDLAGLPERMGWGVAE